MSTENTFSDPKQGGKLLRSIALFKYLKENELIDMYKMGEIREVAPSSHVIVEGEPTRGLYILLDGKVSVYKNNTDKSAMIRLAYLEKGAPFGELSLFDDAPRSATIVAETVCFLFYLDQESFDKFLQKSGDNLTARFYKKCAEDLAERFRTQNHDFMISQQMLWKHALRRDEKPAAESSAE